MTEKNSENSKATGTAAEHADDPEGDLRRAEPAPEQAAGGGERGVADRAEGGDRGGNETRAEDAADGAAREPAADGTGGAGTADANDAADGPAADAAEGGADEARADGGVGDDEPDEDADERAEGPDGPRGGGIAAGAAGVVSAGLGLASVTGTPLSEMLRTREELVGQLEGGGGGIDDQINAFYSAPWHAAALVNGLFALVAVAVGGVLLTLYTRRGGAPSWVRAVALGGVVLGVLGLLVSAGMYLDLFAGPPEAPEMPPAPPTG